MHEPVSLYQLGRVDLIKRVEKLEALLKTAVNMLYQSDVGYRSQWRTEAIDLLYPKACCLGRPYRHDFNCPNYTGPNLA